MGCSVPSYCTAAAKRLQMVCVHCSCSCLGVSRVVRSDTSMMDTSVVRLGNKEGHSYCWQLWAVVGSCGQLSTPVIPLRREGILSE